MLETDMTALARSRPQAVPTDVPGALLRVGLAAFWRASMRDDAELPDLLLEHAALRYGRDPGDWPQLRDHCARHWPPAPGAAGIPAPFAAFVRERGLGLAEALVLTLLGEAEADYVVTLTLTELQRPDGGVRPGVHLVVAILEALFGADVPGALDIGAGRLVQQGIIVVEGDGPLPLRSLRIEAALWSVLSGRSAPWPGCRALPPAARNLLPRETRRRLPHLATLMSKGDAQGLVIRGNSGSGRRALAVELADLLGLCAIEVPLALWRDDAGFRAACQLAGWLPVLRAGVAAGETLALPHTDDGLPFVVVIGNSGAVTGRDMLELELGVPDEGERRALWTAQLDDPALAGELASAALLSGGAIARVGANARVLAQQRGEPLAAQHVAAARAELGAEGLRLLAQPVARRVGRDAVVFAPLVDRHLADFIVRARRRESVWQGLGPTLQASRSAGLRALFVGDSGTGKTLAASFVATELGAPLYRVDLSSVMNKYIGESEKNLALLLDRAAAVDAVLLFDEADSLFGRRTDAKQSGERYANMLTNYLLTAIEQHPGVVVLTTNSRERIDNAFTRRLDVIVDFPLPGFEERLELWHKHLGQRSPGDAVCRMLASYCEFSGGQIRNTVLTAAGCGDAVATAPIAPALLVHALRREYQKLGRALPAQLEPLGR